MTESHVPQRLMNIRALPGYAATFDAIVASLHERPRCGEATRSGAQCRRPASWNVTLHGHPWALMCTQHHNAGLRRVTEWLESGDCVRCKRCERLFYSVADVVTTTRL